MCNDLSAVRVFSTVTCQLSPEVTSLTRLDDVPIAQSFCPASFSNITTRSHFQSSIWQSTKSLFLGIVFVILYANLDPVNRKFFSKKISIIGDVASCVSARLQSEIGKVAHTATFILSKQWKWAKKEVQIRCGSTCQTTHGCATALQLNYFIDSNPQLEKLTVIGYCDKTLPMMNIELKSLTIIDSSSFCDTASLPSSLESLTLERCSGVVNLDLLHLTKLSHLACPGCGAIEAVALRPTTPFLERLLRHAKRCMATRTNHLISGETGADLLMWLAHSLSIADAFTSPKKFLSRALLFDICGYQDLQPSLTDQRKLFTSAHIEEWLTKTISIAYHGNNQKSLQSALRRIIRRIFIDEKFCAVFHDEVSTALASCHDRFDLSIFDLSRYLYIYECIDGLNAVSQQRKITFVARELLYHNLFAMHFVEQKIKELSLERALEVNNSTHMVEGVTIFREELSLFSSVAPLVLAQLHQAIDFPIEVKGPQYYFAKPYFNLGFSKEDAKRISSEIVGELTLRKNWLGVAPNAEEMCRAYKEYLLTYQDKHRVVGDLLDALKKVGLFRQLHSFKSYYSNLSAEGFFEQYAPGTEMSEARRLFRNTPQYLGEQDLPSCLEQKGEGCTIS